MPVLVYLDDIPVGITNSTNATFTLSQSPIGTTTQVFLDGIHQVPSGSTTPVFDYTISDRTIQFLVPPFPGTVVTVKYIVSAGVDVMDGYAWNEGLGNGDGATAEFYVDNTPIVNSTVDVFVDGVHQIINQDFILSETQESVIFNIPPFSGSSVVANYRFPATGI